MTKVYVVMQGEYSDISIRGVFSSKEKAEEIIKTYPKDPYCGTPYIDEFTVDSLQPCLNRSKYYFHFDLNGELTSEDTDVCTLSDACDGLKNLVRVGHIGITIVVFADNRDKAFKIACDMKSKHLAEKNGL